MKAAWRCTEIGIAVSLALSTAYAREANPRETVAFDIDAPSLVQALMQFTQQSGLQLMMPTDGTTEVGAPKVVGSYTPRAALDQLLTGTALKYEFANARTVAIRFADADTRQRQNDLPAVGGSPRAPEALEPDTGTRDSRDSSPSTGAHPPTPDTSDAGTSKKGIPEILVKGSRSLNADIERTEDDIQPYVVFSSEALMRSQDSNVEDFLKTHLPMNTASGTLDQAADSPFNNSGRINLRGLGTEQTLILIDGRRLPGVATLSGDILQPNISGIPISSIERIEVLPATASGIYGGGATGGVINIIRKHNYTGLDVGAKYGNTFKSGVRAVDINLNGGWSSTANTEITFAAAHSETKPLYLADRDFSRRARELLAANNPAAIANAFSPPLARRPNVCGTTAAFYEGYGYFGVCDGTQLTLKDGRPVGGSITSAPAGYASVDGQDGSGFIDNAGRYDLRVPDVGQYLLRAPVTNSASMDVRQSLGQSFEAFIDAAISKSDSDQSSAGQSPISTTLPSGAPGNPFLQDITVTSTSPSLVLPGRSKYETANVATGLVVHLTDAWAATVEGGWSRGRSSFEQTVGGPISAEGAAFLQNYALQDLSTHSVDLSQYQLPVPDRFGGPFDTILKTVSTRVSGPAVLLPAGALAVTGLIERRKETAKNAFVDQSFYAIPDTAPVTTLYPQRSRKVLSSYLEAQIPVIAPLQDVRLVNELDFQVSVRHDRYETRSTKDTPTAATRDGPFPAAEYFKNSVGSTDYTFGFRLRPTADVTLRVSFATGFMAAQLSQITPTTLPQDFPSNDPTINPPDPRRGNTSLSVPRVEILGGNPNLSPEISKSWSAGLVVTPRFLDKLRLSVDYTRIKKSDEIYQPSLLEILQNETAYPGRVTRSLNVPGDQPGWAGPVTQIDASAINNSFAQVSSIDFKGDYEWDLGRAGAIRFTTLVSRMKQLKRQLVPTSQPFDLIGYVDGPLRWRGQGGVTWEWGSWAAAWNAQYYGSYSVLYGSPGLASLNGDRVLNQGSPSVASQTYHDLLVSFRFNGSRGNLLSGVAFSAGIQNVFGTEPQILAPLSVDFFGAGDYSPYGDPRLRRYMLSVRKSL